MTSSSNPTIGPAALSVGTSFFKDKLQQDQEDFSKVYHDYLSRKFNWDNLNTETITTGSQQSTKPTDFYATSNNPTINITGSGPSDNQVKDYLGGLYQNVLNRDPEFNDDPSNTADYWVDAVAKGHHGDRDWKEWLSSSIHGSDEKKSQMGSLSDADKDWIKSLGIGGGGGYKGPTIEDFQSMLQDVFSSPWTPYGYGWGGTNSNVVRINRSQGSRRGSSYAGNNSSFNRSGSRLNSDTLWMNTLGE
jgi:hypothetical protein